MSTRILIGALTALLIASVLAAPAAMAADWPQFHYDIANTGDSSSDAPDDNAMKWISDDIGAVKSSQAMIVDDKVFVYANSKVYALTKANGSVIWSASIPGDTSSFGSWASPAYSNGMVFVSAGYNLTKINATNGSIVQQIAMPNGMYTCNGGPTVTGGRVFAGTYNPSWTGTDPASYYAFNESDLTDELWNFTVNAKYATSTPAVADGKVVVGENIYGALSKLYCLNEVTGAEIWNTTLSKAICGSAAIDAANDRVYVTTYNDGLLHALNLNNGNEVWNATIIASDSTPAISGDYIYVSGSNYGSATGRTYCFNSTGDEQWNVSCGSWTMSPAVADGKLFTGTVGTSTGWYPDEVFYDGINAYNALTGAAIWSHGSAGSSPSVSEDSSDDGMVVSIGIDGRVYAFGTTIQTATITSCDDSGTAKDMFYPGDNVSVKGTGLAASTNYTLWIQNSPIGEGETLATGEDPSGSQVDVKTDASGNFAATTVWTNIPSGTQKEYDIVVDNKDDGSVGKYNEGSDGIDSVGTAGIVAPVPELASAMLVGGGLLMLVGVMRLRRKD